YSNVGLFYKKSPEKIAVTGNPFREDLKNVSRQQALKFFGLNEDLPVLLVLGGGTGSQFFNELIAQALPKLSQSVQIIHSTGAGKHAAKPQKNYHPFEFINNMAAAYAASDIVLCRAGLSTLTELSNL